ncbi:MAG: hypothetical protein ACSHX9_12175 [Luteolibacter sp.]
MKTIITTVLTMLAGLTLISCDESHATKTSTPPDSDPVTVLEEKVEMERQLRVEAEVRADEETSATDLWRLASMGLATLTLVAFFGGTAIGSRGRHHAAVTS